MCSIRTAQSVNRVALGVMTGSIMLACGYAYADLTASHVWPDTNQMEAMAKMSDIKVVMLSLVAIVLACLIVVIVMARNMGQQSVRHSKELSDQDSAHDKETQKLHALIEKITERHAQAYEKAILAQCPIHERVELEEHIRELLRKVAKKEMDIEGS